MGGVRGYNSKSESYEPFIYHTDFFFFQRQLDVDFVNGREEMDLSDYTPSNEWDITANRGRKNVKYYICCPEPFPDITFTLRIRRKVAFYTFILILPCGLLSLLTMVIFYVPPESPAKLQLGG